MKRKKHDAPAPHPFDPSSHRESSDSDENADAYEDFLEDLKSFNETKGITQDKAAPRAKQSVATLTFTKQSIAAAKQPPPEPKGLGPLASETLSSISVGKAKGYVDYDDLKFAKNLQKHLTDTRKLYCPCCSVNMGTRSNIWKRHCSSSEHKEKFEAASQTNSGKKLRQSELVISAASQAASSARPRVDVAEMDHRIRVARMVYSSNISMNAVEKPGELKALVSEARPRQLNLGSNIAYDTKGPLVTSLEAHYVKLMKGRFVLATWDGSPRHDNAHAVCFTVVVDFKVFDLVVAFKLYGAPLNGQDEYNIMIDTALKYNIQRDQLLLGNSDRGAGNKPCVRDLCKFFTRYQHSWCIPHTLNIMGSKMVFPAIVEFCKCWNKVMKNSQGAQTLFYKLTGASFKRKSKVKWWTAFDQQVQLLQFYSNVHPLLLDIKNRGWCKKSVQRAIDISARNQSRTSALSLELAAASDILSPFVKATHFLESAHFIAPYSYDVLKSLTEHAKSIMESQNCPSSMTQLMALFATDPNCDAQRQWLRLAGCARPGLEYFWKFFYLKQEAVDEDDEDGQPVTFKQHIELLRFSRLFCPNKAIAFLTGPAQTFFNWPEWKSVVSPKMVTDEEWTQLTDPDNFAKVIEIYRETLDSMKVVPDVELDMNPVSLLQWWRSNAHRFPKVWALVAERFVLLRPSSALAERIFSVWKAAVPDNALNSNEDTQQLRMQLNFDRYNEERDV